MQEAAVRAYSLLRAEQPVPERQAQPQVQPQVHLRVHLARRAADCCRDVRARGQAAAEPDWIERTAVPLQSVEFPVTAGSVR